jgi:hypothetical protein
MAARAGISAPRKNRKLATLEGIAFGNRLFSEPRRYPRVGGPFLIPREQGLYVVLTPDRRSAPRPFAALYFGEAPDLQRRLTVDHEKYPEWVHKSRKGHLFFAYHPTPGLTDEQRRELEKQLIEEYCPPCNARIDPRSSLRTMQWRLPTTRIQ